MKTSPKTSRLHEHFPALRGPARHAEKSAGNMGQIAALVLPLLAEALFGGKLPDTTEG